MKKQKGFVKILLIIIAVIAVAVFIYIRMGYRTETIPSDTTDNQTSSSLQNFQSSISNESNVASSDNENVKEQAGIIKNIKTTSDGWLLTIDYVSRNPNWLPGVGDESFFLNTDNKLRTLLIPNNLTNGNAKFFECGSEQVTGNYGPFVLSEIKDFVDQLKKQLITEQPVYYFDVQDETINTIRTQCLP